MFTIEHEFDATIVTLVDDGDAPLREDVVIAAFEDCVTVTQVDTRTDMPVTLTLVVGAAARPVPCAGSARRILSFTQER